MPAWRGCGIVQGAGRYFSVCFHTMPADHYLRWTLFRRGGNRAKAAVVFGVSERNIYRLIKQHELGD